MTMPLPSAVQFAHKEGLLLIDGAWVRSGSGATIDVFNPATGERLTAVTSGSAEDVDNAVRAARHSLETGKWVGMKPSQRASIMFRAAELIDRSAEELAHIDILNGGMSMAMATLIAQRAAEVFRYYGGWVTKIHGITSEISEGDLQFHAYTLREPVGVAALIVPWNAPVLFAAEKLAMALAAGCSCVLKPADETPLSALRLGEILIEAGIPAGVVNIVTGVGHVVGAALSAHGDVDKVAFTGSTAVGKAIAQASANGNLKKVTLELGGKSPVIIFNDADIERAIQGAAMGVFSNSGQICIAGSRVYVERGAYERVVDGIAGMAGKLRLGDGFDSSAQLGPLISAKQLGRVTDIIQSGVQQGGELVTGGQRVGERGFFMQPTVMTGLPGDSRVVREEIFGPVVAMAPFDDLEQVLVEANDTEYGLGAVVWTRDIGKAHRMAKRLHAGRIWLNCQLKSDYSMPSGGYKQSGWGREYGWEGIEAYLQTKSVIAAL